MWYLLDFLHSGHYLQWPYWDNIYLTSIFVSPKQGWGWIYLIFDEFQNGDGDGRKSMAIQGNPLKTNQLVIAYKNKNGMGGKWELSDKVFKQIKL